MITLRTTRVGVLGVHISDLQMPLFTKLTSEPHISDSEPHISSSESHIRGSEPHTTGSEPHKKAPVSFVFFFNAFPCLTDEKKKNLFAVISSTVYSSVADLVHFFPYPDPRIQFF